MVFFGHKFLLFVGPGPVRTGPKLPQHQRTIGHVQRPTANHVPMPAVGGGRLFGYPVGTGLLTTVGDVAELMCVAAAFVQNVRRRRRLL